MPAWTVRQPATYYGKTYRKRRGSPLVQWRGRIDCRLAQGLWFTQDGNEQSTVNHEQQILVRRRHHPTLLRSHQPTQMLTVVGGAQLFSEEVLWRIG